MQKSLFISMLLVFCLFPKGIQAQKTNEAPSLALNTGIGIEHIHTRAELDALFKGTTTTLPSSLLPPLDREKEYFWVAAGEVIGVNLLVWSYNRFIAGADWAKISGESMKTNLREGWEWDDNQFSNNQIAHPYHGNLYYNSARSNGFGYWGSIPFTFAGSWMWEYLGETHHPAPNDWLTTSFGGIALGEMLYRFSNLVIDRGATGGRRAWQEFAATLMNPVQGLNRAARGDMGRVGENPESLRPSQLMSRFEFGGMRFGSNEGLDNATTQVYGNLEIWYGSAWDDEIERPYDAFDFRIQANSLDAKLLNSIRVKGSLLGWDLGRGEKSSYNLNVIQYYEYLHNNFFDYGAMSFGVGFYPRWKFSSTISLRTSLHAQLAPIAATSSEFADLAGRTYDYGPGAGALVDLYLNRKGWDWVRLNYLFSWIHTTNGSRSNHLIQGGLVSLVVPVYKMFGLGMEYGFFRRQSYFQDFPDTDRRNGQLRWLVSWRLN